MEEQKGLDVKEEAIYRSEWPTIHKGKYALFLSFANVLESTIYFPFWALKTREQLMKTSTHPSFTPIHTIHQLLSSRQLFSLYRGFWSGAILSSPSYLVYFFSYLKVKHTLQNLDSPYFNVALTPLVAGLLADVASTLCFVPVDVIVQRLQDVNSPYRNARHALKSIIQTEGATALFRGFGASLVTYGVGSGIWWQTYEPLRLAAERQVFNGKFFRENEFACATIGGVGAGITAVLATNPFDVAKTRIQVSNEPNLSFVRILFEIGEKEGLLAYTKGMLPRLMSRIPLSSASALIYEEILKLSEKK